jgi:MOSC domain-containing protein YiiM
MFTGQLIAIAVAANKQEPLQLVAEIEALVGRGLAGDRYSEARGEFSRGENSPDHEVTLIEQESLAAIAREYELSLTHAESRRNLLTAGVPLNHLIGQTFQIGNVQLRGLRLCEPCGYLEKLTQKPVKKALQHRGGLRAQIIRGGVLRIGEVIRPMS